MPRRGKNGYKDNDGMYLIVSDFDEGVWSIFWHDPNDGETGASIGECGDSDEGRRVIACALANGGRKSRDQITWTSKVAAVRAMAAINAMLLAAESAEPWPEWAVRAQSAGWTPPKGWAP